MDEPASRIGSGRSPSIPSTGVRGARVISFSVAAVCIIVVGINLRPGIVSMGPLLPTIRDEFGLSNMMASLLITIPDVLMGVLALPTPWLARRYGRDRVVLAALMLLLIATIIRTFAPSTFILLLTTAGVGAGIAIAGTLIASFVKASFPVRAAFLMSLYATALALGSTLSAVASGPIAQAVDNWRVGSGIWSLLGLSAIAAWLLVQRRVRRAGRDLVTGRRYGLPLRNYKAWLIALFFGCVNFLFYALLSWTASMNIEQGLSATQAGLVLATFIGASMVATPVFGILSRNDDRRPLLAISATLVVAGLFCVAAAPGLGPFLPALLIGVGIAGGFTLGMTLPLDNTRDADEAAVWTAFVLTIGYLIAAAGPISIGALRDLFGGFREAVWVLGCVGLAMLVLSRYLGPRPALYTADDADVENRAP